MDQVTSEILGISKGNKTLAEAFKELGLVREAFEKASRIEQKILENESSISEIRSRMALLSTSAYVDTKAEKLKSMIDSMVKSKFDEYTSHILFELNRKVNDSDAKKDFEGKVNWGAFNDLKHVYGAIKLKLDTHVDMEFVNYKGKVNDQFEKNRNEIKKNHEETKGDVAILRVQFEELNRKVEEVLAEDEESVKSDQSIEDFEKMIKELERNIAPESVEKSIEKNRNNFTPGNKEISMSSVVNHTYKSSCKESKSPLVGFLEPDRLDKTSVEYFGDNFSPSYRKSRQEVFSRKSSVVSTTGGGLKQIARKIPVIEKDITEIFQELRLLPKMFQEINSEIKKIYKEIEEINKRCDRIEEFEKKMEFNFVNRLRNKDMQNKLKKNNVLFNKVPGEELEKLYKEVQVKNKRIIQMDHCLKYLITEVDFLKASQLSRFREFEESLTVLEKDTKYKEKELNSLKSGFSQIECTISENIAKNYEEITRPVYSAKTTDSRMNKRRNSQDSSKYFKEEWSKILANTEKNKNNKEKEKPRQRISSATPKISLQPKQFFN